MGGRAGCFVGVMTHCICEIVTQIMIVLFGSCHILIFCLFVL